VIDGFEVKRVPNFVLVGFTLTEDLKPDLHIETCLKKANSRLFLMYKMRSMGIPLDQLMMFYDLCVQSIFDYVAPVYHHAISERDVKKIERVQKRARKCLRGSTNISSLSSDFVRPSMKNRRQDLCDNLFSKYVSRKDLLIPPVMTKKNGRYIPAPFSRTNRFGHSFIPAQIANFNKMSILNPEVKRRYSQFSRLPP
jgi:hypothetical protein